MSKKCYDSFDATHWKTLNNTSIYRKHDMPIQIISSYIIRFSNCHKDIMIEPRMTYFSPSIILLYRRKDSIKYVEFFKDGRMFAK